MDMITYLSEIEEAATLVLQLGRRELSQIETLEGQLKYLDHDFRVAYDTATRIDLWNDNTDIDREARIAGLRSSQIAHTQRRIEHLRNSIEARRVSVSALAGTILQLGKQGISAVHGASRDSAPPGRRVGGQPLRNVIWEGRNHSMHWEEGKPSDRVEACLDQLAADFNPKLSNYRTQNVSVEILEILGWTTFDDFRTDLMSLA